MPSSVASAPGQSALRLAASVLLAIGVQALSGCSTGVETSYGYARGQSLNGTGVFAERLRERGHTVRSAYRLTDELAGWADVIVRFAPYPGPPAKKEAQWYTDWLTGGIDRCADLRPARLRHGGRVLG